MITTLALAAFERLFNDWIDLDAATRHALDQLAVPEARLLRVVVDAPALSVDVTLDQGRVRLSPTALGQDETPAVSIFEQRPYDRSYAPIKATTTLHVPHLVALARLIGATPGSTGNIPIQGDMALLQALQRIMAEAEPEVASRLAPLIGDMPASQIGQMLQQGQRAFRHTGRALWANASEWLKEDSGLFASRFDHDAQTEHLQDLQADLERLQARLARVQAQKDAAADVQQEAQQQ